MKLILMLALCPALLLLTACNNSQQGRYQLSVVSADAYRIDTQTGEVVLRRFDLQEGNYLLEVIIPAGGVK